MCRLNVELQGAVFIVLFTDVAAHPGGHCSAQDRAFLRQGTGVGVRGQVLEAHYPLPTTHPHPGYR